MFVLEAFQSVVVALLTAYLSFTGSLAEHIESRLSPLSEPEVVEVTPADATPSTELTTLSRLYAGASGVSRILFQNDAFQNAAKTIGNGASIASSLSPEDARSAIERSLVNVYCEYQTNTYTRTTTGTGFFIHGNGVILTNAHVAQFLLLETVDGTVEHAECIIRNGDPASPRYRAELLFISPTWIVNNANLITVSEPRGTGEYDYALLYVSESLTDEPLPERFPAIPIHTNLLSKHLTGSAVLTGGYPAALLSREGKDAELVPKVVPTSIRELYTFGSNYADIFTITESAVGEQGASGGPVVSDTLGAIGLIVTKGDRRTEGEHSLRALTLSYIDRTIIEETGYTLIENASGDLTLRGAVFKDVLAPYLARLLVYEMGN
jgi:hypothetical protein